MSSFTEVLPSVPVTGPKIDEMKRSVAAALTTVLNTRVFPFLRPSNFSAAFCDVSRHQHPLAILSGANSSGLRPIHFAAATNNVGLLQSLLEAFSASPSHYRLLLDCRDHSGHSALHHAILKGSTNAFVLLVQAGAALDVANFEGRTALHLAVTLTGCVPDPAYCNNVVRILLHHGANPNVGDQNGASPLHLASEIGNLSVVDALLEEGANVNYIDDEGETALFYALRGQHEDVVRKLFDYGVDAPMRNSDGETALDFCLAIGDPTMAGLLESLQMQTEELPVLNPRSLSMELSESGLSASSGLWFSGYEVRSSF